MGPSEQRARVKAGYDSRGFAPLDIAVTPGEMDDIEAYLGARAESGHPGNIFDGEGRLRAVHGYEAGLAPGLMARLAAAARALIGCRDVYLYQCRANIKHPAKGGSGGWQPHRDFDYWQRNDGMPAPRAAICHILVNAHHADNGPLILCDGSHEAEIAPETTGEAAWQANFGEDLKFTIPREAVARWPKKTSLTGPAGALFAMHPLTWHYSEANGSAAPRSLLSIVFNDLENQPVLPESADPRPDFIVERP